MLKQKGFTFIELVLVVGLIGILASLAAPNLTFFIHNQALMAEAKDIQGAIQKAKGFAIARNSNVYVEFNNDKSWNIKAVDDSLIEPGTSSSPNHITVTPNPNTGTRVTYNSLGISTTNADGSDQISDITIASNAGIINQSMRVILSGGGIKLCEVIRPNGDPRKCP